MSKKIVLSEMAYYDMDSIFSYISQDGKQAAEKLRVRIYISYIIPRTHLWSKTT